MDIPLSFEESQTLLREKQAVVEKTGKLIKILENNLEGWKKREEGVALWVSVLEGLAQSWRQRVPGRDREAFFCLDSARENRVVVRQFLAPDTKIYETKKAWEANHPKGIGDYFDAVPPGYPVIDIKDAAEDNCPECGHPGLIVDCCYRTHSPYMYTWVTERLIVCFDCGRISSIGKKTRDQRF